jgi:hypothetical protein
MLLLAAALGAPAAAPGYIQLGYAMASGFEQRALSGNLDAQRELADCLTKGCPGVQPNRALACAWRIVIVAGGTSGVAAADVENRRLACEGLSAGERAEAVAQARSLVKKVHGRDLVLPADFFGGPARAK